MPRKCIKKYSRGLKQQAVQEYLSGKGSLREECRKYGIADKHSFKDWIKWNNGHKEIRASRKAGREIYMTKGRKPHKLSELKT